MCLYLSLSISLSLSHSLSLSLSVCLSLCLSLSLSLSLSIYLLTAVSAGTELTFDYQWPPSERAPTQCFCGSESCRGFLEINTINTPKSIKNKERNNHKNDNDYDVHNNFNRKKGLWKSKKDFFDSFNPKEINEVIIQKEENESKLKTEVENSDNDTNNKIKILDENEIKNEKKVMKFDPFLLVGKYVKIWWQSNLRYFEADVKEYSLKTGEENLRCRMNFLFFFIFFYFLFFIFYFLFFFSFHFLSIFFSYESFFQLIFYCILFCRSIID